MNLLLLSESGQEIVTSLNRVTYDIIKDLMKAEGCTTAREYVDGWISTMDEIDSQSVEDFTPYTTKTVLPVACGTIDNNARLFTMDGKPVRIANLYKGLMTELTVMLSKEKRGLKS